MLRQARNIGATKRKQTVLTQPESCIFPPRPIPRKSHAHHAFRALLSRKTVRCAATVMLHCTRRDSIFALGRPEPR
jgi:hypothetical protein